MNDIKLVTSERNNPMLYKVRLQMYVWWGASLRLVIKGNRYQGIWDTYFKHLVALKLGIGGGRTEYVRCLDSVSREAKTILRLSCTSVQLASAWKRVNSSVLHGDLEPASERFNCVY